MIIVPVSLIILFSLVIFILPVTQIKVGMLFLQHCSQNLAEDPLCLKVDHKYTPACM